MPATSIEEARKIMNGPTNYFGPPLGEFLDQNRNVQPDDVSEEDKLHMWRNHGSLNFFGPDEWRKYFAGKIDLSKIPDIPWTKNDLEKPILRETHFLFIGLDTLESKPTTIPLLQDLFRGPNHPKFSYSLAADAKAEINKRHCETKWYLMHVDGFSKPGLKLASSLPIEYQQAHAVERVLGNILYHLLNNVYLDSDFTSVDDVLYPGSEMAFVSSFITDGLIIDSGELGLFRGIAASRRTAAEITQIKAQINQIKNSSDEIEK